MVAIIPSPLIGTLGSRCRILWFGACKIISLHASSTVLVPLATYSNQQHHRTSDMCDFDAFLVSTFYLKCSGLFLVLFVQKDSCNQVFRKRFQPRCLGCHDSFGGLPMERRRQALCKLLSCLNIVRLGWKQQTKCFVISWLSDWSITLSLAVRPLGTLELDKQASVKDRDRRCTLGLVGSKKSATMTNRVLE